MNRRITCLFLLGLLAAPVSAQAKPSNVKLTKRKVDSSEFLLGLGVKGEIPESAYRAKIGREEYLLWDLDADEKLEPGAADGLSMKGAPFLVQLPSELLLPTGQFRLSFPDSKKLTLTPVALDLPKKLIASASLMTPARMRHGLAPLLLDEQACKDCLAHCDYLEQNAVGSGMSLHDEDSTKPGYTAAGARAGKNSSILPGSSGIDETILWCRATIWHAAPMMSPLARRFGVGDAHGYSLIYHVDVDDFPAAPFAYPADGATEVPREFAKQGEVPTPVLGTQYGRGCGHPVFLLLPRKLQNKKLTSATLTGPKDRPVKGTISSPIAPANPAWPTNSGCAVFVPAMALAPNTIYSARFEIEGEEPIVWSFRTAK